MADFNLKIKEENGVIVVTTDGYLNNYGGEQVASLCLQKISEGKRKFLINVEKTDMVDVLDPPESPINRTSPKRTQNCQKYFSYILLINLKTYISQQKSYIIKIYGRKIR